MPLPLASRFSQISAWSLFEMLRPAAFVVAVLLSAWVLADARRRGLRLYAVAAWTLLTLVSPPIVFPVYLVARMLARRLQSAPASSNADDSDTNAPNETLTETNRTTATETTARDDDHLASRENSASAADSSAGATDSSASQTASPASANGSHPPKWWRALPLLYASVVLSLAALFFLRDYRSVDAHLARAENAKLFLQSDRAIREYRAALQLDDDPHTRKLLAVELASAGRTEEALAEFLAAERGGEPDERLPYYIAAALNTLNRPAEAQAYYRKFLDGSACARTPPDARCARARARLKDF